MARFSARNLLFRFHGGRDRPLVTVVVPMYNERRFVRDCLASVRRQSYRNFECLIVNDGSTDDSREVAASSIRGDGRFRIIDHPENRGLPASRNTGLRAAKGHHVTFLDSDDVLLRHAIWRRVHVAERNVAPGVAGTYCRVMPLAETGKARDLWGPSLLPRIGVIKDFITCEGQCPFPVHAALIRTEVALRFGGFDESMRRGAEDWDLWRRMMRNGYCFLPTDYLGGGYRQKPNSMVRTMGPDHVRHAMRLLDLADEPADPSLAVPDAPFFFERPVAYYRRQLYRAPRIIAYATMTYLNGDIQGYQCILAHLPERSYPYLSRHLNLPHLINTAVLRFDCAEAGGGAGPRRDVSNVREEVLRALRQRTGGPNRPAARAAPDVSGPPEASRPAVGPATQ